MNDKKDNENDFEKTKEELRSIFQRETKRVKEFTMFIVDKMKKIKEDRLNRSKSDVNN